LALKIFRFRLKVEHLRSQDVPRIRAA